MTKFLMVILLTISSLQAIATEINLHTTNAYDYDYYSFSSGEYDINKDLGRAWVVLKYSGSDPEAMGQEVRVKIPGMSFDKTTKEVIIETEQGRIVCAVEKKFLRMKSLRATKECSFKEKIFTVNYDDGFEIKKIQKRTIVFKY